jgi:hypothetical protein
VHSKVLIKSSQYLPTPNHFFDSFHLRLFIENVIRKIFLNPFKNTCSKKYSNIIYDNVTFRVPIILLVYISSHH